MSGGIMSRGDYVRGIMSVSQQYRVPKGSPMDGRRLWWEGFVEKTCFEPGVKKSIWSKFQRSEKVLALDGAGSTNGKMSAFVINDAFVKTKYVIM